MDLHSRHLLGGETPVFLGDETMGASFQLDDGEVGFHLASYASPKFYPHRDNKSGGGAERRPNKKSPEGGQQSKPEGTLKVDR